MSKKYLLIILAIVAVLFIWSHSTKSEEDTKSEENTSYIQSYNDTDEEDIGDYIDDVYNRAYEVGFEEGYDLAKEEFSGEFVISKYELEQDAYDLGYDKGYDAGYWDAMDEMGLDTSHGYYKIEKE